MLANFGSFASPESRANLRFGKLKLLFLNRGVDAKKESKIRTVEAVCVALLQQTGTDELSLLSFPSE